MSSHDSQLEDAFGPLLGLAPGSVRLRPHTDHWVALYQHEAARILAAIGDQVVDIEHIGSTAIAGIQAKPIIDIVAGLRQLAHWRRCQAPLAALGYDYAPQAGIPDHRVFGKGSVRRYLLHLVAYGSPTWHDNVRFRNTLRADHALAKEYETLKLQLAAQFSESRAAYTAAKAEFIQRVLAHETD